ncbi:U3 small nucleolar RNA-associated protein 5 [Bienertia sinuspersici]
MGLLYRIVTWDRRDVAVETSLDKTKAEDVDGTQIDDNEPTMEDKLATLDLEKKDNSEIAERPDPPQTQPPSADSVHVLLKQALHADDRALLLDCLYNQDNKVIANSVSLLNAVDIFKLLDSLLQSSVKGCSFGMCYSLAKEFTSPTF